jgi:AGZA family xanthine/uracil permease-like MFS transporter
MRAALGRERAAHVRGHVRDHVPILAKTGDPIKAWEAGLVWVFFQSFIPMIGGFFAPIIRKITPRAALLGTLAGVSVAFISMRPAMEIYMTPAIGLRIAGHHSGAWFGGVRYPRGIPAGSRGSDRRRHANRPGFDGGGFGRRRHELSADGLFGNFGFLGAHAGHRPRVQRFRFPGRHPGHRDLRSASGDLVEAMDNVESAEAAGDSYPDDARAHSPTAW